MHIFEYFYDPLAYKNFSVLNRLFSIYCQLNPDLDVKNLDRDKY